GFASTAPASPLARPDGAAGPPHAPRNRDDCDQVLRRRRCDVCLRLTPPGIATTATSHCTAVLAIVKSASRPPESRRLRPTVVTTVLVPAVPPHAPRNRDDCDLIPLTC